MSSLWSNGYIGSQLPFGRLFTFSNEQLSRGPQHEGDKGYQPLADSYSQERDLRSGLASMVVILIASAVFQIGWTWSGAALATYGIFGLLLRIGLWSLWRLM